MEYEFNETELDAAIARDSFRHFIEFVKPDYQFNWHHLLLIEALQKLSDGYYSRLIVQMPPRHGKSELVSRLFPAWCFARNQNEQVIVASYSLDLASAMNRDCQRVITSKEYTSLFPEARVSEGKEVGVVRTNKRFDIVGGKGYYIASGVGGGITGVGATVAIIDDPVKNAAEADSQTYRDSTWEWYTTTFKTRFEPGCVEVICQTRWHEDDLTGRVLLNNLSDTEVISLPALSEKQEDKRSIGEALWATRFNRETLKTIQAEIGSRAWNALYQQRPAPVEGSLIKRGWFSYYNVRDFDITGKRVNFYFDTAYTDKEKNDPTAAIAYIKENADFYVLDCISEWLEFPAQMLLVSRFTAKNGYSSSSIIRVEPKATGKSLVQVAKKETNLNVVEGVAPQGSKMARVNSVAGVLEAGRVFLPSGMSWVEDFLNECTAFPNAAHDDRVDCLTGMLIAEGVLMNAQTRRRVAGF